MVGYIVTALAAYLLGSIPTGYLLGRAKGLDIRTVGSGNIGATNVFRFFGPAAGAGVLLADALKGWVSAAPLAKWVWTWMQAPAEALVWYHIIGGVAAILGHNYPCWLRFKGGKGIATSAGVMVALVPLALLVALGVWLVVFGLGRFVSLGSIVAAAVLPFATWLTVPTENRLPLIVMTLVMAALAIFKHKTNIRRLLNGTENRIGTRKSPAAAEPSKGTG